jgi:hypothetical protein
MMTHIYNPSNSGGGLSFEANKGKNSGESLPQKQVRHDSDLSYSADRGWKIMAQGSLGKS